MTSRPGCFAPMAAAERYIGFITANLHLCAMRYHLPRLILPDHHRGFFTAMTDGSDFSHFIRKRQKSCRARKQLALEINP